MPLRVTVELIPRGDDRHKRTVAVVDICNDGTGTNEVGNYAVRAEGNCRGGYDTFFHGRVAGVKRGDYLNTVIDCLRVLRTADRRRAVAAVDANEAELGAAIDAANARNEARYVSGQPRLAQGETK